MRNTAVLAVIVAGVCVPALGDLSGLAGWTDEFGFTWQGTSSISLTEESGLSLTARIDWVVPYDTASGMFHYIYQLTNIGEVDVTKFGMLMLPSNEANTYGWFATGAGEVIPSGIGFDLPADPPLEPLAAYWTFASLAPGQTSAALDYWSVNEPLAWNGYIQNHGGCVDGNWDLPSPDNQIPEPASMVFLAAGALAALGRRRK